MTWAATAITGGSLLSGYLSGQQQKKSASRAAGAQIESAELGIEEQRRQFDEIRELLSPFVSAGESALGQQLALTGLEGAPAQREAIGMIEQSPEFQAITQQGEQAILQQASATGGLRGGNVQGALGQFRPAVLSDLINQQYSRLGGLTGVGQASAAGVGVAGQATAGNVSNLMQAQGAARANEAIARGQASANQLGALTQGLGTFAGLQGKLF